MACVDDKPNCGSCSACTFSHTRFYKASHEPLCCGTMRCVRKSCCGCIVKGNLRVEPLHRRGLRPVPLPPVSRHARVGGNRAPFDFPLPLRYRWARRASPSCSRRKKLDTPSSNARASRQALTTGLGMRRDQSKRAWKHRGSSTETGEEPAQGSVRR